MQPVLDVPGGFAQEDPAAEDAAFPLSMRGETMPSSWEQQVWQERCGVIDRPLGKLRFQDP